MTLDKKSAYKFILLMGSVSLLSDFTYEGAKGIIGPFLAHLGASALMVSLISGSSELAGYWLRLFSGLVSDRLRSYWTLTIFGYILNLFSVPMLGLVRDWLSAGALVLLERSGKGLRTPPRDSLLSGATQAVGHGKGFGLHEFLDQLGAVLGPLTVAFILFLGLGYRAAFLFLFLPAFLAFVLLMFARKFGQHALRKKDEGPFHLEKPFYVYLFASCLIALGFLQFPLIGYHLSQSFEGWQVALFFALAMGVDALSALFFGYLFDRMGFFALVLGLMPGLLATPTIFYGYPLLGVFLWGASMGVQESIMRSGIAVLSPQSSRGRAYGLFHFFYGLSTFFGALLMGWLYELSLTYLVVCSITLQILSLLILIRLRQV